MIERQCQETVSAEEEQLLRSALKRLEDSRIIDILNEVKELVIKGERTEPPELSLSIHPQRKKGHLSKSSYAEARLEWNYPQIGAYLGHPWNYIIVKAPLHSDTLSIEIWEEYWHYSRDIARATRHPEPTILLDVNLTYEEWGDRNNLKGILLDGLAELRQPKLGKPYI